jgi:hypothetical protein
VKRINIILLIVLAVSVGMFGAYQFLIHRNLDRVGPVIHMDEGILEISVEEPETALMQGVTALDERDGDVTGSLLVESIYGIDAEGYTTVNYAAFDSAGNVTKAQRQIRYRDYCAPRFTLECSPTFAHDSGFDFLDHVGAYDVLEGDIRRRVHATLVSDTNTIDDQGNHKVKLQVTNSMGDTVELVIPVLVYDPEWYTADVELSEYMVYLKQGSRFDARSYLRSFIVRGEPTNVRYTIPEGISMEITDKVRTNAPGVYEVTYILSQNLNMTVYTGIAKLIVVVE